MLPPAPATLGARPGRYLGQVSDWTDREPGRRRTRKAWWFANVFTPELTVGFAVVDAGLVAQAFSYVARGGVLEQHRALRPLGFRHGFAPHPDADWQLGAWRVERCGTGWQLTAPGLTAEITDAGPGLTAISTSPGRPWHQTWKSLGLPATVTVDGHSYDGTAAVDVTLGHPPRSTAWRWASLASPSHHINLVAHLGDGLENAVWTGGRIVPVGQALITPGEDWRVATVDGAVDVRFTPECAREQDLRLGLLRSTFSQPVGSWSGRVLGEEVAGRGVVEEHRALW